MALSKLYTIGTITVYLKCCCSGFVIAFQNFPMQSSWGLKDLEFFYPQCICGISVWKDGPGAGLDMEANVETGNLSTARPSKQQNLC